MEQQARWRTIGKRLLWPVGAVIAVLAVLFVTNRLFIHHPLWDWIKLLIVPAILAGGGLWFNTQQRVREQQIANARAQDEALQAYLDQMSDMLMPNKDQPSLYKARPGDSLSSVARARTLTVLPRLDGERKARVVQFLYESGLITKEHLVLDLRGADLSGADLSGADLSKASLRGTNLSKAILRNADMYETDLRKADLREADMREAILSDATLNRANLAGANLSKAILEYDIPHGGGAKLLWANLTGCNLSKASLRGTKLSKAILRNADMGEAHLQHASLDKADLSKADLSHATLTWTNLTGATLCKVKLRWASLYQVNLSDADMSGADLSDANLEWGTWRRSNLSGVKGMCNEQLEQLVSSYGPSYSADLEFQGATMPNGQKYEDWLKDREGHKENAGDD